MAARKKKKVCFDFKVGDRVTVLAPTVMDGVSGISDAGSTGVIVSVDPRDGFDYEVKFDSPITLFGSVIESRVYKEQYLSTQIDLATVAKEELSLHELIYNEYEIVKSYNTGVNHIKRCVEHVSVHRADMSRECLEDRLQQIHSDVDTLKRLREDLQETREKIRASIKQYI